MFELPINYVALLVSAVAVFLLGWIWYGPIFGKAWMKEVGLKQSDIDGSQKGMAKSYVLMYLANIVMGYVLAHILQFADAASTAEAINTAFWVWLGFFAAGSIHYYLFPIKSFKLYLIDNAYQLVSLIIIAVILTSWV